MKSLNTERTDMSIPERGGTAGRKRPAAIVFLILLLFFGLLQFYSVTRSPQFESYRTIDIVRLVLAGACFGAALHWGIAKLLRPGR